MCLSNLKQQGLCMLMYAGDNDDLAPDSSHWMDQTASYTKAPSIFHCTDLPGDPSKQYGYAMRTKLGNANLQQLKDADNTAILFDSLLLEKNANTNLVLIPGFPRHKGRQNVVMANGRAKGFPVSPSRSSTGIK